MDEICRQISLEIVGSLKSSPLNFFFFIKTDFLFCKFWVTHILSAGLNDLNIKKSEKNDFLLFCLLKGADRGVFRARGRVTLEVDFFYALP